MDTVSANTINLKLFVHKLFYNYLNKLRPININQLS